MSGRLLRVVCTTALCAALTVSPATAASAEPGPVPSEESAPLTEETAGTASTDTEDAEDTADTADAEDATDATEDSPGTADPDAAEVDAETALGAPEAPRSVAALLRELQTRYRSAEEASETYNATAEKLKQRTAQVKKVNADLAKARAALELSRGDAGRLAREQYQGRTEFSAYLRLLLSRDPLRALDQTHVVGRLAANRAATVDRLTDDARRADTLAAASRKALDQQKKLADRQKKQRDAVRGKLKEVEGLLATLSEEQMTQLAGLEQRGVDKAQRDLVASGALSSTRPPTRQGGDAVAYAVRQIGKPYVWGAEGPASFDCSGLTSQAWSAAGRTIPRTSQEQWKQLPKVPVSALRPGDLVIYFPKATHVALYIGNGLVVQAPRPGTKVKVSPLASNPLLGAVRPDPGGAPLSTYTPPELPEGARDGADTGYGTDAAPDAP
ncbi:glycoside hydrolase [Streptomyces sp. Root63]|uniref:C40 family peptidase n=1 Tax=Streptomyces TaxID=1883 RepID=UPI0006F5A417|nr:MULTISPECIES: C40 family peptidase [unclassified Streptomyces]KQX35912.1 glycoside hydrolase [Streptomyces sp. Root1295]KRA39774.1 glycoside hydrolase [Streptomyces sp. Root63]MDF9806642.1 cell wall-associated NlpC family hydrolase [Streptomyces sp. HB372]